MRIVRAIAPLILAVLAVVALAPAPAAANQIDVYFVAAQVTWTNQPAADTEFTGTPRVRVGLTNMSWARFVISLPAGTVNAGADCRVQYSTDGTTFASLNGGTGPELALAVQADPLVTAWFGIAAAAKADVRLRVMCKDGNGAADPQFRVLMVSFLGTAGGGGADGFNSLVTVTTASESPGANCANGGTKVTVQSGLDNGDGGGTARDGILQSGEVDATTIYYSCKGDTGATGPQGPPGFNSLVNVTVINPGPPLTCGNPPDIFTTTNGGLLVEWGVDDGGFPVIAGDAGNGILDPQEVDGSENVCNGADGSPGHSALVRLTPEPVGANCAQGGTKIEGGTDLDDDTALDLGEITFTEYACDGAAGPAGPGGGTGPRGREGPPGEPADLTVCGSAFAIVFLAIAVHVLRKRHHVPVPRAPPEEEG